MEGLRIKVPVVTRDVDPIRSERELKLSLIGQYMMQGELGLAAALEAEIAGAEVTDIVHDQKASTPVNNSNTGSRISIRGIRAMSGTYDENVK